MDERELRDVQDSVTWSDEGGIRPPVRAPRAVGLVARAHEAFERVAGHATRQEMKISTCIRETVLEQIIATEGGETVIGVSGGV